MWESEMVGHWNFWGWEIRAIAAGFLLSSVESGGIHRTGVFGRCTGDRWVVLHTRDLRFVRQPAAWKHAACGDLAFFSQPGLIIHSVLGASSLRELPFALAGSIIGGHLREDFGF